ncbi:MAG: extracellular solute-binding protein [Eubacteriales bacterium]|nr:extracellular solute-binding protein [Eubacteriales bacterium]
MKKKLTKLIIAVVSIAMLLSICGCSSKNETAYQALPGLDTSKQITIKIAIPYKTNKALNTVSNAFMNQYPNVSIQLQYVEDYDSNAVELFKDGSVDVILQKDVKYTEYTSTDKKSQKKVANGTTTDDFFYNFAADTEINFSNTTADISDNYRHTMQNEAGEELVYQYCYPIGGETRGVFVNKTLLAQYGLSVPSNYAEFLACCNKIKENGLIPIQGSPDSAAYGLGIAPAANYIVHNEAALQKMAAAEVGVSEEFKETMSQLYELAKNRYFDYKTVEDMGTFQASNELGQAEGFLGLMTDTTTFKVKAPENQIGYVAFLPYLSSMETVIQTLIEEYSLKTEFTFICSPLNDAKSNSPVYITPYYGVCINKNSENLVWLREFVNFLFTKENNTVYAQEASIIPNIPEALQYVAKAYGVNVDKDITLCGQIRFSDSYNGFTPVSKGLTSAFKCSALKYMVALNKDADGNIQYQTDDAGRRFLYLENGETMIYEEYIGEEDPLNPGYAFCTLQYYLDALDAQFEKYRS